MLWHSKLAHDDGTSARNASRKCDDRGGAMVGEVVDDGVLRFGANGERRHTSRRLGCRNRRRIKVKVKAKRSKERQKSTRRRA